MTVLVFSSFIGLEPAIAGAVTDDVQITQVVTSEISITSPSDITLTPLTMSQLTAVGSATWTVTTNNQTGYTVNVKADAVDALTDDAASESFTDYTEASAGVKETWSVSNAYEFGFSGYGNDTTGYGTDAQPDCINGANVPSVELLWEGFSTSDVEIASSSAETPYAGTATTICVATEQDTVWAPSGTYYATTTATAVTQ